MKAVLSAGIKIIIIIIPCCQCCAYMYYVRMQLDVNHDAVLSAGIKIDNHYYYSHVE